MKKTKKLDLQVFKLVILLGISKSGYYNNRKVISKFRRDPQLKLIMMASHTNKKIWSKGIAKYIKQNNNIKVFNRTVDNYLKL